jgi:hypothetical protein
VAKLDSCVVHDTGLLPAADHELRLVVRQLPTGSRVQVHALLACPGGAAS